MMFMQNYFYWCGVIANALVGFWLIVGMVVVLNNWRWERKIQKKYARKNIDN